MDERTGSSENRLGADISSYHFHHRRGDIPFTVKAMKGGAVDFLTKPVDETVLLATVEQTLQKDRGARLEAFEQADLLARYCSLMRKMKADSFAMLVRLATKLSPEQSVAPGRDN